MRWLIFILFLMPNFAAADKATRDQVLYEMSQVMHCTAVLSPWTDSMQGLYEHEEKAFRKNQLIMQFEVDEKAFSMERLQARSEEFRLNETLRWSSLRKRVLSLPEEEKNYLQIKLEEAVLELEDLMKRLMADPYFLAEETQQCLKKYDLDY